MLLVAILQDKYWYLHSEGFQRVCNECSTNKSVAQMLPRWLRICSKWSTFRRPAASRTPEDVQHAQAAIKKDQQLTAQELEADWGIPKTTVSEILRVLAWIVSWQNSFRSFCYQGRRNIVLQLLMTWFKPLPMNRIWQLLAFPKTKITFEREEISNHWWDSGKYNSVADGDWENCVRSQSAYFEGNWGILVQCFLYLASSSTSVSIFHIAWLDTTWTFLVHA